MDLVLRKERGCVKENSIFSKFSINDIKDMVLAPCNKDIKEKICVGFVTHSCFRILCFTRHLKHEHDAEDILCLYPQKWLLLRNILKMGC